MESCSNKSQWRLTEWVGIFLQIIVIALLMTSIMKRRFNVFQWEALFLLVAGITVNQLSTCDGSKYADMMSPAALMYTLGSVSIPSLASVYNEFALKKHMETSVLLQNFFLYFYGAVFNFIGLVGMGIVTGVYPSGGIFAGFRGVTVALVINNALQGILSSFFYKFADTILKKYSSTIATIVTGLMSALLFGHAVTLNFVLGVSIVFISMHLFFSLGTFFPSFIHKLNPIPLKPSCCHCWRCLCFSFSSFSSSSSFALVLPYHHHHHHDTPTYIPSFFAGGTKGGTPISTKKKTGASSNGTEDHYQHDRDSTASLRLSPSMDHFNIGGHSRNTSMGTNPNGNGYPTVSLHDNLV